MHVIIIFTSQDAETAAGTCFKIPHVYVGCSSLRRRLFSRQLKLFLVQLAGRATAGVYVEVPGRQSDRQRHTPAHIGHPRGPPITTSRALIGPVNDRLPQPHILPQDRALPRISPISKSLQGLSFRFQEQRAGPIRWIPSKRRSRVFRPPPSRSRSTAPAPCARVLLIVPILHILSAAYPPLS